MTLKTEPVKMENYSLEAVDNVKALSIRLKGTFDMTATPDLSLFLVSIESEIKRLRFQEITVDVADVYYLGSSCIKSFVSLIESLKKLDFLPRARVLISPRLDWHERTFSILARLAPALVSIEKAR